MGHCRWMRKATMTYIMTNYVFSRKRLVSLRKASKANNETTYSIIVILLLYFIMMVRNRL
jgi:hypothetical protein